MTTQPSVKEELQEKDNLSLNEKFENRISYKIADS